MEPTGAGGASGDSHQRRHQTNRQGGGAAVAIWGECNDLGKVASPKSSHGRRLIPPWIPFSEWFFREKANEFFIKIIEKVAAKKVWQTHTQTNRQILADPEHLRGRVLDSQNADTIRKNLQNVSPKHDPEFS